MNFSDNFIKNHFSRVAGILCAVVVILLSFWNPIFVHILHLKTYDIFLRNKPGIKTEPPVIIVDIDDQSLAKLGQWPWNRTVLSEIVSYINRGNPKAIGLDIVFAEPDRVSPKRIAAALEWDKIPNSFQKIFSSLPDHDQIFAKTLKATNTVLGFTFTFSSKSKPAILFNQPEQFAVIGKDPMPWLFKPLSAVTNLKMLEKAASGSGFFNILPDEDGIIRRLPLIMQYNENIYSSLVMKMLEKGGDGADLQIFCTSTGIESVKAGTTIIPTDAYGQMNIKFCGKEKTFPYISAADIISKKIDPTLFHNAYVLVGTSAKGLLDTVATPTSALFPGVEVHAHAMNTILAKSFIKEPNWAKGAEFVNLLAVSLLLIILIPAIGAVRSGFLFFGLNGIIVFISYWLFCKYDYFFDSIYPLLGNSLIFMTLTFVKYVQEEQERKNTKAAFSKYLSPVLVNELLSSPEKLTLKGEEREISILFSDIRNFTSISEKISPENVCSFLNQYFTAMSQILMDNRATVDKFIGDAVYAFWNAPLYDASHANHAIIAALQMRQALKELNNDKWKVKNLPFIHAGIGINTGIARIGNIGSENHMGYTAIGDSVNLTSRLESITKVYGTPIIVSDATYNQVKNEDFIFRKLDRIRVKGKDKPITVHELIGQKDQVSTEIMQDIKQYHKALSAYFECEFKNAAQIFQQLSDKNYSKLYQLFTLRCRHYIQNPPKKPWDGISTFLSK